MEPNRKEVTCIIDLNTINHSQKGFSCKQVYHQLSPLFSFHVSVNKPPLPSPPLTGDLNKQVDNKFPMLGKVYSFSKSGKLMISMNPACSGCQQLNALAISSWTHFCLNVQTEAAPHSEQPGGHRWCPVLIQPVLLQHQRIPESWRCQQAPGEPSALDTRSERPSQVQTESVVRKTTLQLLSTFICLVSALRGSYQLLLCVPEPFTLLLTQNQKRFSMDCWSPIAERCTCPPPVSQVS